jgi:hypothetical protein
MMTIVSIIQAREEDEPNDFPTIKKKNKPQNTQNTQKKKKEKF